jgi:hypothetical protein
MLTMKGVSLFWLYYFHLGNNLICPYFLCSKLCVFLFRRMNIVIFWKFVVLKDMQIPPDKN